MDKTRLKPGIGDIVVALVLLAMGFFFWEWELLFESGGGLGGFLFFLIDTAAAFAYLQWRGVRQNPKSIAALIVVLLGLLPFLLYDQRDISILNCMFEVCAYLLWLGFSCKTLIGEKLSGFLVVDSFRQWFIVPFANFGKLFSSFGAFSGKRSATQSRPSEFSEEPSGESADTTGQRPATSPVRSALLLLLGLIISIPVILLIISLLASSDDGFGNFVDKFAELFKLEEIPTYLFNFILGIPVACYIFGAIFGNALQNHSFPLPIERADEALGKAHVIPRIALYAPLVLLAVVFVTYFITMAAYLFSAFGGELPTSYTYAQYARKGFFELCAVATINLALLAFTYLLARRQIREYPPFLRVLTGFISLCTSLLILTAMSKMLLYIGTYGLTRLRIYTLWFMVLLLLVFLVLLVWHIKSFKLGRILVIIPLVCSLALFLTNTDGIIARYNVGQYLSGNTAEIDAQTLAYLSDGALPYLHELEEYAPDEDVRAAAATAIQDHESGNLWMFYSYETAQAYYNWNIQSALTRS